MDNIHKLPTRIFHDARREGKSIEDAVLAVVTKYPNLSLDRLRTILDIETARLARVGLAKLAEPPDAS